MISMQMAALVLSVSSVGETTMLDFSAEWCGPCRSMVPVVQQMEAAGFPIRRVNIDQEKALASQFHVHGIPCFVMLVDGREVDRVEGATDRGKLQDMFRKAGFRPGDNSNLAKGGNGAGQMGQAGQAELVPLGRNGGGGTYARQDLPGYPSLRSSTPGAADEKPRLGRESVAVQPSSRVSIPREPDNSTSNAVVTASATSAVASPATIAGQFPKSLYASVRLKIEDPTGSSLGSGTIIDAGDGEALILTCGHVFRDSDGKGRISVDIFGPKPLSNVPGKLVHYDLKSDVGLVSIRVKDPVQVAKIAPPGYQVRKGDPVYTVGCNHGADPTVRESRVTSLDKFLGPANVQVAGQPVQGRSGGGLFTKDGLVIGVCNAADPSDDEGLFAAVTSVHAELDKTGLAFVYRASNQALTPSALAAGAPPEMPSKMPAQPFSSLKENPVTPVNDRSVGPAICIIRPSDDPNAKSEVVVLNQVSPAFWTQLEAERKAQASRQGERR